MMPKTVARSLAERRKRGEKPQAIRAWWMLVNEPDAPAALRGAARAMRLLWHVGRGAASARPYLTVDEAVAVWQRAVAVGLAARKAADIERIVLDHGYRLALVRTAGPCPRCGDWVAEGEKICRADGSKSVVLTVDAQTLAWLEGTDAEG